LFPIYYCRQYNELSVQSIIGIKHNYYSVYL